MKKRDFLHLLAGKMGNVSERQAEIAYNAFVETLHEALKTREPLQLGRIMKMQIVKRPARKAHNPATNEPMVVPEGIRLRVKMNRHAFE